MRSETVKIVRSFLTLVLSTLIVSCGSPATVAPTVEATEPPQPAETATTVPTPSITTSEDGTHALTLVWRSEFTPEAALGAAVDIALDKDGNLFVTTASIKKYDSEGNFVILWGDRVGTGDGEFSLSTGIATDWEGNVYVDDFRNRRIQKFDNDGNYLMQWPTARAGSPGSTVVDKDGNVFVSFFGSDEGNLQKYDPQGNLITSWGGTGNGDGQFAGRIEDIAIDQDGNIYVTDSYNHRIQKFDNDGNFLLKIGGESSRDGHGTFTNPLGIGVDYDGNIYVVDNYFLQKFDAWGNFITQWPRAAGTELDRAGFFTFDEQGNLYILARSEITNASGSFDILFIKKFSLSD
jgi:DNA-binding beta-propeller fold protein YncE